MRLRQVGGSTEVTIATYPSPPKKTKIASTKVMSYVSKIFFMADVSGPAPKKYSAGHLTLRGQKPQNRVWLCSGTKTKLSDSNDSNTISQE